MGSFFKKSKQSVSLDPARLPRHIGIIMDGNGRWAQKRGLPRTAGHLAGMQAFRRISAHADDLGIEQVTFYAFSTENWKRPKDEVDKIMKILSDYVDEGIEDCHTRKARIRFLGDLSPLDKDMRERIHKLEQMTAQYAPKTLNIALNYGGRDEIVHSVRKLAKHVADGTLQPEEISESLIGENLYFDDLSECDLIIRPSGELRLSNFLLWQSAYSEFVFDDILWPDYQPENLNQAILQFQKRQRRFGAI